jgi:hypothetical protein
LETGHAVMDFLVRDVRRVAIVIAGKRCQVPFSGRAGFRILLSNPNCATARDGNSPNHTVCIFYGTTAAEERVPDTLFPPLFPLTPFSPPAEHKSSIRRKGRIFDPCGVGDDQKVGASYP